MGKHDVSTTKFMDVHSAGHEVPCLTWYKNTLLVLSVRQWNPVHILTPCLRSILVFVCLNINHEVYSGHPVKIFYVFVTFLMHIVCLAHSSGFDHHNSVKNANYKYLPFSCYFLSPRFNKSPQHYCQTLAASVFLLCVQSQVAHP